MKRKSLKIRTLASRIAAAPMTSTARGGAANAPRGT